MKKKRFSQSGFFFCEIIVFALILLGSGNFVQSQALPTGEPAVDEVRFAALGDTGNGNNGQVAIAGRMFELQRTTRFNLILFLGDNIYPDGSPGDFGRKFALPYKNFIENGTDLRACVGNHDVRGKNEGGVLLQQMMFQMGSKPYYSFVRGNQTIEFFAIDSNSFIGGEASDESLAQLQWLDSQLNRSTAKWKVVFLHHSLYSSARKHGWNSNDQNEMENVRRAIEPLLEKHRVKLVLSGHDHTYERVKLQKGVRHFVAGAGSEVRKGNLQTNSPFYEFGNDKELSFMLFSAKPGSIEFWTLNPQGNIMDSGKIE